MHGLATMISMPPRRADRQRPAALLQRAATLAERQELEAFIRQRYAEAFGARIEHFLPALYALRDRDGQLQAALGLRPASAQPLFLEHYLEQPVEQALAAASGRPVARHQVVEVGNLAGRDPGALRQLLPRMGELLRHEGHRWLVFTGHTRLLNGFERMGITLLPLAPARLERLEPAARTAWGSYYQHAPMVMGCDIQAGHRQLQAQLERQAGHGPLDRADA